MIRRLKGGELDLSVLEIKDVLDINMLQKFQDNFAESMNIASVTVDKDGNPVTKPSSYTSFCEYTHSTKIGDDRCAKSHKKGGEEATRSGKPYIYKCHAGLIDFAAPIIIEGKSIGTILGGQILYAKPIELEFRKTAKEIGMDEDKYIEALNKIKIIEEKNVKAAAELLYVVANYLSKIGYEQIKHDSESQDKLTSIAQVLNNSFSQISATMEELAVSSVNVTNNQHMLAQNINDINEISVDINNILNSIRSIADKTKMLGLNAAIEAARAGESGRGFGVVASEIRTLSENSKETTKKIVSLTTKIQSAVTKALDESKSTMETTEHQSSSIEEVTGNIEELSGLVEELSSIVSV
ncbi:PocR ligand-binding domain-containing protein [Clostridium sp. WILCCON 0269]|uniref:PocR ligand-binding domain-containing protein n=1 Tax=Candidatus Clostridium eludens TaxID=3381663 RepID=A0ABW8SE48_9CLOT